MVVYCLRTNLQGRQHFHSCNRVLELGVISLLNSTREKGAPSEGEANARGVTIGLLEKAGFVGIQVLQLLHMTPFLNFAT